MWEWDRVKDRDNFYVFIIVSFIYFKCSFLSRCVRRQTFIFKHCIIVNNKDWLILYKKNSRPWLSNLQLDDDGPSSVDELFAEAVEGVGQVGAESDHGVCHTLIVHLARLLHQRHQHRTRWAVHKADSVQYCRGAQVVCTLNWLNTVVHS